MKLFPAIVVFLFTLPVSAQSGAGAPLTDVIVVTASSVPTTIEETPAAVSVITREEIERRAARELADVLREVPGVAIARTGSPGKATSLFLRGGSSKQALVLWNGVEMNNPYFSGYDFGQLSTAGVERVEIVRGPFSALYGSEAASGVVNVLTSPRTSGGRLEIEGGEHGLFNASASGALTYDRWSAHAAAERRTDEGFASNDDFASTSILGGITARLADSISIGLTARRAAYDLGIPFTPNADSTAFVASPQRRQEGSETQLVAPIRYERGATAYELRLSDSRRSEIFSDISGPFGAESSDTTSSIRNARAIAQFGALTVGGEYEESTVDHLSNFSEIDERERTSRAAFVENRMSIGGVELVAGLRYDHFDTFGSELSPRVAVAWLRGGNKIRAAYGEGFRAPAIGELYSPFFGNVDLQAERTRTIEAGYDRFGISGSASITFFRSDYDELIVFGESFAFENIAAADAHGVELSATRRVGPFTAAASYTWLRTEDESAGETLVRRPEHSGSVALGYDAGALSAHVVLLHSGERADVTDLVPFGRVISDAYTTADVVVAWRRGAYQPFAKIENLTDENYQEVFGYASGRRRVRIGLRYVLR